MPDRPTRTRTTTASTNGAKKQVRRLADDSRPLSVMDSPAVKQAMRRGKIAIPLDELAGKLQRGQLNGAVDRPPTLDSRASRRDDGRLTRLVLLRLVDEHDRPARGVELALVDGDALVDRVRSDRRGLALLRLPAVAGPGSVSGLGRTTAKLRIAASEALEIDVPAKTQHVVRQLQVPSVAGSTTDALDAAVDALEEAATALAQTTDSAELDGLDEAAGEALGAASESLAAAAEALSTATTTGGDILAAVTAATQAATAALQAAEAASDLADAVAGITELASVLAAAVQALTVLVARESEEIPDDSVVSRLPVTFSPAAADAVTRLLEVAEGMIPGLGPAVHGISVSRTPLIKRMSVLRVVPGEGGKPARRFLVRIRQEWTFIGYTLGRLARVDSLDPGTVIGTLDASATAQASLFAGLDAGTASALQASLDARLSAHASVDTVLDVAARARLDAKLAAAARVGVRHDKEPLSADSVGDFFANLGDNLADILLPDVGGEAEVGLDATVDVDAHTTFSLDSSLVASGRLNAAASLVNRATVTLSSALGVSASLSARASASVNPSLSRAVNLLRFELLENYAVASAVEDVLEIRDEPIFKELPDDLFPPADILDYRRHFEPRLLERRLAPHFDALARGFATMRRGGDPIPQVRVRVEYAAASSVGADLTISIAGTSRTLSLRPGTSSGELVITFPSPRLPAEINEVRLGLSTAPIAPFPSFPGFPGFQPSLPASHMGATVRRVELIYHRGDAADVVYDVGAANAGELTVNGDDPFASVSKVIDPPDLDLELETDPLVVHIDRNPHHYLGVLAEAALRNPALRTDAPQLADVHPDLWRLPLLGFEGGVALRLEAPAAGDPVVDRLLQDEGAATVVQLAAAGLYTEAAQGQLAIGDAVGRLHPALSWVAPAIDLSTLGPILTGLAAQAGNAPALPSIPGATVPGATGLVGGLGRLGGLGN